MIDDALFILLPYSLYVHLCPQASRARDLAYREGYLAALEKPGHRSLFQSMLITEVKLELEDLKRTSAKSPGRRYRQPTQTLD